MNKLANETAIGIVTCNRPDMFKQCFTSIDPSVGDIYIVNSGEKFEFDYTVKEFIQCDKNPTPVGHAKNKLLRAMRHSGKKYLFLIEDDVKVKDNSVFEKYILTASDTGLWSGQLCYGYHSLANRQKDGSPFIKDTVDYTNCSVDLYPNACQAFTLYHANSIKILGYFDDFYKNAAEHLDHYYAAFIKGLGNYFWWFPDIENSFQYIEDIDQNYEQSVIRKDPNWENDMKLAWAWFARKWKYYPTTIPHVSKTQVLERLNFIETHYSKKDIVNELLQTTPGQETG